MLRNSILPACDPSGIDESRSFSIYVNFDYDPTLVLGMITKTTLFSPKGYLKKSR